MSGDGSEHDTDGDISVGVTVCSSCICSLEVLTRCDVKVKVLQLKHQGK